MIRTLIVDDEPRAIKTLEILLERHCKNVLVIGTASNVKEAYQIIQDKAPALIFLDINMPNGSGLELLEKIKENKKSKVIFVTAYEEFAIQAFRLSAFDYLLKPVDKNDLIEAVDRLSTVTEANEIKKTDLLSEHIKSQNQTRKIALNTSESLHIVDMDEILYLSSKRNYTQVHFAETTLLVTKQLGFFEDLLQNHKFMRIHRSFMINLVRAKEYRKKQMEVVLDDGTSLEVARNRRDQLVDELFSL